MSNLRDELASRTGTAMRDRIQAALYESDLVDLTFAGDLADALLPLVEARVRQAYADGYEWALAHLRDEAVQADLARIARTAPTGEAGT